ncbi:hypothetical protein LIER_35474 [Lithospermum erythrorhizon]|uniref:Uncharacterized protein n=1 Tax=Lithospermum erythrorhizon TaxID=34254 RepID=A0AAV3NV80_LITER
MARPSIPIRQLSQLNKKAVVRNNSRPSNRHAPQIRSAGSARCVQRFDDSLLQFTLLIAIRCVLHRWENQEIRCQKLFLDFRRPHYQSSFIYVQILWCEPHLKKKGFHRNDPSAGSPTDTLLRLLLPLNDQVCKSLSRQGAIAGSPMYSPKSSLSHSIGSSDGRCVQRAGT